MAGVVLLQVAALVVLLLVVRQNRVLHRQVGARIASSNRFMPGDLLGALPLNDLAGRPAALDLRQGRRLMVIVNPHCGSCEKTMSELRGDTAAVVVSLASPEDTRPVAESNGIAAITYTPPGKGLPAAIDQKLHTYPQILLLDRGRVVRTCLDLKECRN